MSLIFELLMCSCVPLVFKKKLLLQLANHWRTRPIVEAIAEEPFKGNKHYYARFKQGQVLYGVCRVIEDDEEYVSSYSIRYMRADMMQLLTPLFMAIIKTYAQQKRSADNPPEAEA